MAGDEREGGRRATLNYGHTLAHALEIAGDFDLRHGEAVAIGLVYAAELARVLGRIDDDAGGRAPPGGRRPTTCRSTLPAGVDPDELVDAVRPRQEGHRRPHVRARRPRRRRAGHRRRPGRHRRRLRGHDADATERGAVTEPVVLLLSGPNLNLLGEREPAIYGTATLDDHVATAPTAAAEATATTVEHVQSNHEGELVDAIHGGPGPVRGHRHQRRRLHPLRLGLHDALAAFDGPVVELHLSNPNAREPWRHTSVIAPVATGTICGFGGAGYRWPSTPPSGAST